MQTHNPRNPKIFNDLKNAFNFLKTSKKFSELLESTILIKSERQPKNLGNLLQHSNFSRQIKARGSVKCNNIKCGTCDYLLEADRIYFNRVDIYFKLMTNFSCDIRNIIYKITCKGCNEYYIGLTTNLRRCTSNHKFCIFNLANRIQKVHQHIFSCASNFPEQPFTIIPFYKVKRDTNIARLATESYFIRKFKPYLNTYI